MTTEDLKASIRLQKEAGHSSKVCLPIIVLEQLIAQVEVYEKLPPFAREASLWGGEKA